MPERMLGINKIGEFSHSPLLAGYFPIETAAVTLVTGQVYKVGSVLERQADGRCVLLDSAHNVAADPGNNIEEYIATPYAVLVEEIDATNEDRPAAAYITGTFIRERLVFGGTDTWETHELAAKSVSIFFKDAAQEPNG